MADTPEVICNLALGRVRAQTIQSLSENSPSAVACRDLYEPTRDHLLTLYAWRFAKAIKALSLKDESTAEWQYVYDYPNDCLCVHYIVPGASAAITAPRVAHHPIRYEIATGADGSRRIFSNSENACVSYTKQITDTTLFDPLFDQALAWLLAIDLAIRLGGDSGKPYRVGAQQAFDAAMDQAVIHSENESEPGTGRLPRSIRARGGDAADYFYNDRAYWGR